MEINMQQKRLTFLMAEMHTPTPWTCSFHVTRVGEPRTIQADERTSRHVWLKHGASVSTSLVALEWSSFSPLFHFRRVDTSTPGFRAS